MEKITKKITVLLLILILMGCANSELFVTYDENMLMGTPPPNYVTNPNFDYPDEHGQRSFYGWEVGGCATLVRPPKPGAFKAGPVDFDGGCQVGETAVVTQTISITPTTPLIFSFQPLIVGNGNHLIVTISDGAGWEWVAYESSLQDKNWDFVPFETFTPPPDAEAIILRIEATYGGSLGIKVRGLTVRPEG